MSCRRGYGTYDARGALEKLNMGNVIEIASRDAGRLTQELMELDPSLKIGLKEVGKNTLITKLTGEELEKALRDGARAECTADKELLERWCKELRRGREIRVPAKYARTVCELIVKYEPSMLVMAEKKDDVAVIKVITHEEANRMGNGAVRLHVDAGLKGRYMN